MVSRSLTSAELFLMQYINIRGFIDLQETASSVFPLDAEFDHKFKKQFIDVAPKRFLSWN